MYIFTQSVLPDQCSHFKFRHFYNFTPFRPLLHSSVHSSLLNINTGHIPYVISVIADVKKQSGWTKSDPGITLVDGAVTELWLEVGHLYGRLWTPSLVDGARDLPSGDQGSILGRSHVSMSTLQCVINITH